MFLFEVSCSSHDSLLLVSEAIFQHPHSSVAEFISDLQPTIRLGGTYPSNSVYPQSSSLASPGPSSTVYLSRMQWLQAVPEIPVRPSDWLSSSSLIRSPETIFFFATMRSVFSITFLTMSR